MNKRMAMNGGEYRGNYKSNFIDPYRLESPPIGGDKDGG